MLENEQPRDVGQFRGAFASAQYGNYLAVKGKLLVEKGHYCRGSYEAAVVVLREAILRMDDADALQKSKSLRAMLDGARADLHLALTEVGRTCLGSGAVNKARAVFHEAAVLEDSTDEASPGAARIAYDAACRICIEMQNGLRPNSLQQAQQAKEQIERAFAIAEAFPNMELGRWYLRDLERELCLLTAFFPTWTPLPTGRPR